MSNHMHIKNYNEYYFFFVETTADCNLRCPYCYFNKADKKPDYSPDELVKGLNRYEKAVICFLGGEPFLNVPFMEAIMTHPGLKNKKVVFASNTNGTLFRNMKPELLAKFSFHHLSTDGYGKTNDALRGKGAYNKVIDSIKFMRKFSNAGVIARITVCNPDQILDIPKLEPDFDAVYWQLNNTRAELGDYFLPRYLENLHTIFNYWKDIIFSNKYFTLVPFIGMCDLILTGGMAVPDLICGSGTDHCNVCIDGSVYPCPESPHRLSTKERLGHIIGFEFKTYPLKQRCKACDIVKFCGGRCAMTDDDLYCDGVREIYNVLIKFLGSLNEGQKRQLKEHIDYQKGLAYTTEIIP